MVPLHLKTAPSLVYVLCDRRATDSSQVMGKGSVALVDVNGAEQQKRFKRTAVLQEVYMGQWEVSNEAVNIAMTELRNQVSRARGCPGGWQHGCAHRRGPHGRVHCEDGL